MLRDTFLEINLDNLEFNINLIRSKLNENVKICAVIKADAYGHGAISIAKKLIELDVEYLAVATLVEALELRDYFKSAKILIMGYTQDYNLKYVVNNNITQTIFSYEQGVILDGLSKEKEVISNVHIKYDTGFNRLGFKDNFESIEEILKISKLSNVHIEGMFSHFSLSDSGRDKVQFNKFAKAIELLKENNLNIDLTHISDSIASIRYPEYSLDMVRLGALIYGYQSTNDIQIPLKSVMTFKTKISHIKEISKGEHLGYDENWTADAKIKIATLPFGYADGYPRKTSEDTFVTIGGKKAKILGLLCMDQCMVDVTDMENIEVGDEVIIFSDGNNNTMDLNTLSRISDTNKNSLLCAMNRRTPKVYIENGKIIETKYYLLKGDLNEYQQ